jgi:Na+-translocating ferredoxin:NAD+ oxidoreductase RnfE subunit
VVAAPLLFLEPEVDDDFPLVAALFFLCAALATTSLYGNTITIGVATTMLVSVLQHAAFLSFFFGGPLHYMKKES